MKAYLFRTLFLVLLISGTAVQAVEPPSFQGKRRPYIRYATPFPAPVVSWYKNAAGITNISRDQGKVVLLNFWATWCESCLHELPALDQLESYVDNANFKVLTVNLDNAKPSIIGAYFNRLGIQSLPLLRDPLGHSFDAYGIHEGLPWSFLIDQRGHIQGYMMGAAEWVAPEGRSLIDYYLNK